MNLEHCKELVDQWRQALSAPVADLSTISAAVDRIIDQESCRPHLSRIADELFGYRREPITVEECMGRLADLLYAQERKNAASANTFEILYDLLKLPACLEIYADATRIGYRSQNTLLPEGLLDSWSNLLDIDEASAAPIFAGAEWLLRTMQGLRIDFGKYVRRSFATEVRGSGDLFALDLSPEDTGGWDIQIAAAGTPNQAYSVEFTLSAAGTVLEPVEGESVILAFGDQRLQRVTDREGKVMVSNLSEEELETLIIELKLE